MLYDLKQGNSSEFFFAAGQEFGGFDMHRSQSTLIGTLNFMRIKVDTYG